MEAARHRGLGGMRCIECGSVAITERSERTARGHRRSLCRACGKQFNARSETVPNRAQYPSDVIALVVLWRLRDKLSLRDLPEMLLIRGIVFRHDRAAKRCDGRRRLAKKRRLFLMARPLTEPSGQLGRRTCDTVSGDIPPIS
jgi:hypothetical protein